MNYASIKQQLIQRLTANVTKLQAVYGYERINPAGYPFANLVSMENENTFDTNAENMRNYRFRLTVFEQMGQEPPNAAASDNPKERAERIIDDVVDEVIDYFEQRANITLGGQVTWVGAVPSRRIYVDGPAGWLRGAEIILEVHNHVSIA